MPFFRRNPGASAAPLHPEADAFFTRLESWKSDLPITNFRGFALRVEGDALQLQVGNIDLLPGKVDEGEMIPTTDRSVAFNVYLPTEEAIPLIVESCQNGILNLPGAGQIKLFARRWKQQLDFHDLWSGLKSGFPRNLWLSVRLDDIPDDYFPGAELDYALRSSTVPFSSRQDLFDKFGLMKPVGFATLEIRAHNPISISPSESALENGALCVKILASDFVDIEKVSVGYASPDSMVDRGRLAFVERDGGHLKFAATGLPGRQYQLLALYNNENVDEAVVIDPARHFSPCAAILGAFDPALAVIKAYVMGQGKKDSKDFEAGIAMLFSLLGFNVLPLYVAPKLNEAPDSVIATPEFRIGVVECTLLDLNNKDKLSKLRRRTEQICAYLREHDKASTVVLPIIVSALPMSELAADLPMARENKVCVLAKEQLEHFFVKVSLHPTPERVFSELMALVN